MDSQCNHAFEREKYGGWVGKKEGSFHETRFYLFHLKVEKQSKSKKGREAQLLI